MPFGGNDWLALTQEPTLEPELPICDPHHHLWDLRPQRLPNQRYLLPRVGGRHQQRPQTCVPPFSSKPGPCTAPTGRRRCARWVKWSSFRAWPPPAPAGFTVLGRAAAAIVGHADLNLGDRVAPVLEALQAASPNRFRGIRHSVTWDPHPEVENTAAHNRAGAIGQRRLSGRRPGAVSHGPVPGGLALLSSVAGTGRLCPVPARPDHHPEPYRRIDPSRPLRRPG